MCFTRLPKRIGPKAQSTLAIGFRQMRGPAAVVFEETASHKPLSSAAWADRSALVPKVPAQSRKSLRNAQTHRLSIQVSDVLLVQCPKEPVHSNIGFGIEDYVFLK